MHAHLIGIKIKHSDHSSDNEIRVISSENKNGSSKYSNPMPKSITELMRPRSNNSTEGEKEYCNKYKFHFNRGLSEYAVSKLIFVDSSAKQISYDKLNDLMKGNGIKLPEEFPQGDLHYVINKIRAEHKLDTVKTDIHALRLAIECLENPNIEEGEIFLQWLEHMYRVKKDILWDKFMED